MYKWKFIVQGCYDNKMLSVTTNTPGKFPRIRRVVEVLAGTGTTVLRSTVFRAIVQLLWLINIEREMKIGVPLVEVCIVNYPVNCFP